MSTVQFRQAPTYTEQIAQGQKNNAVWYRYFQQNELGTPPSGELTVTATASPFVYVAPSKGFMIVTGAVTGVVYSRTAGVFYPVSGAQTATQSNTFPMSQNDVLKISFSGVAPALVFVPT